MRGLRKTLGHGVKGKDKCEDNGQWDDRPWNMDYGRTGRTIKKKRKKDLLGWAL